MQSPVAYCGDEENLGGEGEGGGPPGDDGCPSGQFCCGELCMTFSDGSFPIECDDVQCF